MWTGKAWIPVSWKRKTLRLPFPPTLYRDLSNPRRAVPPSAAAQLHGRGNEDENSGFPTRHALGQCWPARGKQPLGKARSDCCWLGSLSPLRNPGDARQRWGCPGERVAFVKSAGSAGCMEWLLYITLNSPREGRAHSEKGVRTCFARQGRPIDHGLAVLDGEREVGSGRPTGKEGPWGCCLMSSSI